MPSRRCWLLVSLILVWLTSSGCGGKVFIEEGDPEPAVSSGASSSSGTGGQPPVPRQQAIERIYAPDETHVVIEFAAPVDPQWLQPFSYQIDAPEGGLHVLAVQHLPDGNTLELHTDKQPLGLRYDLTIEEHTAAFLSADTAEFWVVDFASPDFVQERITARRLDIGEHVVTYVQNGLSMSNATDVGSYFDNTVYPKSTSLFSEAPDRDGNDRIVLLGIDGQDLVGGYFSTVDPLSDEEAWNTHNFHSNEKELLYLNTSYGYVYAPESVVPHEFGHLLHHEVTNKQDAGWTYHTEGIAECVVRAVNGDYPDPIFTYQSDPLGNLANGQSLIDWEFANYSQYAQAYLFFSYIASQLEGIDTYVELMNLDGSPSTMESYLQQRLGKGMAETMHAMMVAAWAQHPDGEHGFNGFIQWQTTPVAATASDLALPPMAGAFIPTAATSVDIPPGKGANVLMAGIDGAGNVDLTPPFAVSGGIVVALNSNMTSGSAPEPVGLFPPTTATHHHGEADQRAWLHPPPFDPSRLSRLKAWRKATRHHAQGL